MNKNLYWLIGLFLLICACNKSEYLTLSTSDHIGADVLDSFTIQSSTILFDSIPTSGQGRILTGGISDETSGVTSSNSYLQVDYQDLSFPDHTSFDSLCLVLYYDGYYYGDTLNAQSLTVHRLSQNLALQEIPSYLDDDEKPVFVNSSALYNTSSVPYDDEILATKTFLPHPNQKDSLVIRLPDTMGLEWFNFIQNNADEFSSSAAFLEYFKGFALVSGNLNKNITGFKTDSSCVKLHYDYINSDGFSKTNYLSFSFNSTLHFNKIIGKRQGTAFENLVDDKTEILSTDHEGKSLVQSGTGIVTKLNFVGLPNFYEANHLSINHAELRIPIEINKYKEIRYPQNLILMYANKNNTPVSLLGSFESAAETQYGILTKENSAIDQFYYSFNVTNELETIYKNELLKKPLLLCYPLDKLFSTLEQAIILNNSNRPIKLIITYTKL